LPTFGFELEWDVNATPLVRELYVRSHSIRDDRTPYLMGCDYLHRYHCSCAEACSAYSGYTLRATTDSSCNGEIISNVFHPDEDGEWMRLRDTLNAIQTTAVNVDAEPGLNSGMHVHVGGYDWINAINLDGRWSRGAKPLVAFAKYEKVLLDISGGRWMRNRGFNNSVADIMNRGLRNQFTETEYQDYADWVRIQSTTSPGDLSAFRWVLTTDRVDGRRKRALYNSAVEFHAMADRHSNLNISTGHGTWEYRLWNSTRSAWRMQLWIRLSLALMDENVYNAMYEAPMDDVTLDGFLGIISEHSDIDTYNLLARQVSYLETLTEEVHYAPLTAV
jgi:hypothetical protein